VWVLLPTDVVVRCVPAGESIASAESASLDAAEKVAVIVADWPTCIEVPRDELAAWLEEEKAADVQR